MHLVVFLLILCATSFTQKLHASGNLDSISELSIEDLLGIEVDVASSDKKTLQNTPSSVTVISNADLQNYNFLSLAEALESVVGITVYRSYLKRDLLTSRGVLQDIYANKTLILVNKIPLWNAVTGEGNLERISIEDIEQIEILRGPASVQYGTNAYSGVVNIVLKQKTAPGTELKVRLSQYGEQKSAANYSCTQGDLEIFISASSSSGDGKPESFTDENGIIGTVNEYMHTTSITANVSYLGHTVLANTFRSEESFLGFVPDFSSGIGFPHRVDGTMASYMYKHQFAKLTVRLKSVVDVQSRMMARDAINNIQANVEGYQTVVGGTARYDFSSAFNAELGFDNYYRKSVEYRNYYVQSGETVHRIFDKALFDGNNNMDAVSMLENSATLQLHYQTGRLSTLAGSRYTINSYGGHNISSHFAWLYAFTASNSLKLIYGESYRAPSLFELYFKYPSVLGLTSLKPETCRSVEAVYVYSASKFFAQTLLYWARYDQKIYRKKMIDFVFDGQPLAEITQYHNGGISDAVGAEFEVSYRDPKRISMFVNIDYTKGITGGTEEEDYNDNFRYIPRSNISGGLSKRFGMFSVSTVGNYYSSARGPHRIIAAQFVADFSLGIRHKLWGKYIDHTLYVKNIEDRQRMLPEHVRFKSLNEIPSGNGRSIGYSVLLRL